MLSISTSLATVSSGAARPRTCRNTIPSKGGKQTRTCTATKAAQSIRFKRRKAKKPSRSRPKTMPVVNSPPPNAMMTNMTAWPCAKAARSTTPFAPCDTIAATSG